MGEGADLEGAGRPWYRVDPVPVSSSSANAATLLPPGAGGEGYVLDDGTGQTPRLDRQNVAGGREPRPPGHGADVSLARTTCSCSRAGNSTPAHEILSDGNVLASMCR